MEKDKALDLLYNGENASDTRYALEELAIFPEDDVVTAIVDTVLKTKLKSVAEAAKVTLMEFSKLKRSVIEGALRMIYSENAMVRHVGIELLAHYENDSLSAIAQLMVDKDHNIRKYGLDIISLIKTKESLELNSTLLDDENPNVKYTAVENIQYFTDHLDKVESLLNKVLESIDPNDIYGLSAIYATLEKTKVKSENILKTAREKVKDASLPFSKHYFYRIMLLQGDMHSLNIAKENAKEINLEKDIEKSLSVYEEWKEFNVIVTP